MGWGWECTHVRVFVCVQHRVCDAERWERGREG
jgi:hypothetical protein